MKRATKNYEVQGIEVSPQNGLDFSRPSNTIDSTYLTRAVNVAYGSDSGIPESRYGVEVVTTDANALGAEILGLKKFYNGTTTYLMAACADQKLYQMSLAVLEGGTPAWTEVGATDSASIVPSMRTFNSSFMFAGGGRIRTWDGTTYGSLTGTGAPTKATALSEIRNRLVSNETASGGLDAVIFSATEDETDMDPSSSGLLLRAGYKDGMEVNGFTVFSDSLVISKVGVDGGSRKFWRIDTADSTAANWYSKELLDEYAASNAQAIIKAGSDVIFGDDSGVHGLRGTDEYGDLSYNPFGDKINKVISANRLTVRNMFYSSVLHALIVQFSGVANMYLWFPRGGWAVWNLSDVIMTSAEEINGVLYFGSLDGRLYRYKTDGDATDETTETDSANFSTILRTKKFSFGGYGGILKRSSLNLIPLSSGSGILEAVKDDESTARTLKTFDVDDGRTLIGEATGLIGEADDLIGAGGLAPTNMKARQRVRDTGVMFQVRLTSGARARINFLSAEIATPVGR